MIKVTTSFFYKIWIMRLKPFMMFSISGGRIPVI